VAIFTEAVQYLITGLLVGGVYVLMSIGLALIFGVMRVMNFAQGDFLMLGMYVTYYFAAAGGVGTAAGRIEYRGHDVTTTPAHLRAALGMAHVPEGRHIFPSLTVLENLEMDSYRAAARTHRPQSLAEVFALFPVLQQVRARLAGTLSGGEQQMLAIGRALMSRPELLLLDEPSQGLAPSSSR
jgi:ABC-type branched-subunit amino acid transport system ATPase component